MKDKRLVVPVDEAEHARIVEHVYKKGLDGIAPYVRMLIRADMMVNAKDQQTRRPHIKDHENGDTDESKGA